MENQDASIRKEKKREHGLSDDRKALLEDTLRRHKGAFDRLSKR